MPYPLKWHFVFLASWSVCTWLCLSLVEPGYRDPPPLEWFYLASSFWRDTLLAPLLAPSRSHGGTVNFFREETSCLKLGVIFLRILFQKFFFRKSALRYPGISKKPSWRLALESRTWYPGSLPPRLVTWTGRVHSVGPSSPGIKCSPHLVPWCRHQIRPLHNVWECPEQRRVGIDWANECGRIFLHIVFQGSQISYSESVFAKCLNLFHWGGDKNCEALGLELLFLQKIAWLILNTSFVTDTVSNPPQNVS